MAGADHGRGDVDAADCHHAAQSSMVTAWRAERSCSARATHLAQIKPAAAHHLAQIGRRGRAPCVLAGTADAVAGLGSIEAD